MTEEIKISYPEIDPLFQNDVLYLIGHVQRLDTAMKFKKNTLQLWHDEIMLFYFGIVCEQTICLRE